jgi:nucleoside-triphosphatase THEP1
MKVIIISANINSGKTTYAKNLIREDRSKYLGFLSFSNKEKNSFYLNDITNDEKIPLMDECYDQSLERMGRFYIRQGAFKAAHDSLLNQLEADSNKIAVIDEVGRLELCGKGFNELLRDLLMKHISMLLCIRKCFVADVIKSYGLDRFELEIIEIPYKEELNK